MIIAFLVPIGSVKAAIVNINPDFNDLLNPINLFLNAGSYNVRVVGVAEGGIADAWTPWANTTCNNPDGCTVTRPTTNTGWVTKYNVLSPDITKVTVNGINVPAVDSIPDDLSFVTGDYFLVTPGITRYHVGTQALVYPDPATALANSIPSTFTLSAAGLVGFSIDDIRPLGDNRGGLSLSVTAVPLPATAWLFLSGIFGLFGISRAIERKEIL